MFSAIETPTKAVRPVHMRMRQFVGALALALMAAVAPVGASVVPLTLEEMVAVADEIHTVRVTKTESSFWEGKIITRADVEVVETFKGSLTGTTSLTYAGGRVGPVGMLSLPGTELQEGETSVLILSYASSRATTTAERNALDLSSPLVVSPQLVGGFQGRLLLANPAAKSAATPGATATAPTASGMQTAEGTVSDLNTAVVRRMQPARRANAPAPVTYPELRTALHKLVSDSKALAASGAPARRIAGIRGEYHVPGRSELAAVRALDPLPELAYMSEAEVEMIRVQLREQAARRAAQANSPKPPSSGVQAPNTGARQ